MTELAVLVPVLNRPQNVAPLVASFLAGCPTDSKLIFLGMASDRAEWAACLAADDGERVLLRHSGRAHTWPQKINKGTTLAFSDWLLCAADDIAFTPGWWDATAELRANPAIGVIGTNDLGNPRIPTSDLVIHPIVRATYIRDYGTIDEPGKIVHEGYHHWCCDDELLWTAKLRNAYAYCPEAIIEHLHPYWGKGEMDDTYRAGEAHANEDLALWRDRATRLLGLSFA